MAEKGAQVAVVARSEAQLDETTAQAAPGQVTPIVCDVSNPGAVNEMYERVHAELGPATILVNAAGAFGPISLIKDVDPLAWRDTIAINTIAPFFVCRAFLGGMLEAGWGRIVNVSSAASLHPPGALNSAYGVSKVALNQFTRQLAAEVAGSGVAANVIHPGDVKTDMWADIRDRVKDLGPVADPYVQWAEWVEETGGDPPRKAVDLVLRLTSDAGGRSSGMFHWIDDPLQLPIQSWDAPAA